MKKEQKNCQGRGKQLTLPCLVCNTGGSNGSGSAAVSPVPTEQRVVVPPEVPQDTRNSTEDMEISQLKAKRESIGIC